MRWRKPRGVNRGATFSRKGKGHRAGATLLFTRAVVPRGAAPAAVFPALVPPFTVLTGWLVLVPTLFQLIGMLIVLVGFRLTQKA